MIAMEMELIQVPDAIEPYIGFKYLRWHNGKLWSDVGANPWPINKPFEAECHGKRKYKWEAVTGTPNPRSAEEIDVSSFSVTGRREHLAGRHQDPPSVALPEGLSWSWEPQPCDHDPVDENCRCGIYAVDNPELCADYGPPGVQGQTAGGFFAFSWSLAPNKPGEKVLVELAMWGKVIPGTTGMRGQFAYPQRIHGSSDAAREAAKAYGVPLVEKDPPKTEKTSAFIPFTLNTSSFDFSVTDRPHKRDKLTYLLWGAVAVNLGAAAFNILLASI